MPWWAAGSRLTWPSCSTGSRGGQSNREASPPTTSTDGAVRDWYEALHRSNVTVDFAHPAADLSRYRLVIAPALYLVDEPAIANLRGWVEGGGTLVMSFVSGIVDANDHVRLGGYPKPFADVLGLVVDEWAPQPADAVIRLRTSDGRGLRSTFWCDVVRLEGAEALATYADDYFAGSAAVTSHRHGEGTAFYVGTRLDPDGTAWVGERACTAAGIQVDEPAPGGRRDRATERRSSDVDVRPQSFGFGCRSVGRSVGYEPPKWRTGRRDGPRRAGRRRHRPVGVDPSIQWPDVVGAPHRPAPSRRQRQLRASDRPDGGHRTNFCSTRMKVQLSRR